MKKALLIAALTATPLLAGDWPQFLGTSRNATSDETGLLKEFPEDGPKVEWTSKIEGGFGGAAISGDEVFLGDRVEKEKDMLLCLDLKTGEEKWRYESPSEGEPSYPGSRSVPTVEEDAVYFLGTYGEVFRINRKTGKEDWKTKLSDRYPDAETPKWGYAQCTFIVGDTLIVMPFGTETGVAAWDKKTGQELWKSGPIGVSHSSPILANFANTPQIILLSDGEEGGLHSYDPKTGKKLWASTAYTSRWCITPPVQIDNTRLFVSNGYESGSKMLSVTKSGEDFEIKELWSTKKGSQVHSPLLIKDHLYFLANENANYKTKTRRSKGGLVCYTLDGKELWSTGNDPFMGRGASLYADDKLFIQDGENGTLRLVSPSPDGYKLLAEANVFGTDPESRKDLKYWSPLALANGKLILRGQDKLLCLNIKE